MNGTAERNGAAANGGRRRKKGRGRSARAKALHRGLLLITRALATIREVEGAWLDDAVGGMPAGMELELDTAPLYNLRNVVADAYGAELEGRS